VDIVARVPLSVLSVLVNSVLRLFAAWTLTIFTCDGCDTSKHPWIVANVDMPQAQTRRTRIAASHASAERY
jgi:hypothetical protein